MKNLNPYNDDPCSFLDDIIKTKRYSKKDPNYRIRLNVLIPNVKLYYNDYINAHNINNHLSLSPSISDNQNKNDLLKLYSSKDKKLIEFKYSRTTVYDNRIKKICQYCTINSCNTLDHIVPKEEYSEFAVNPLNLLPACSECNSYKGKYWKKGGNRLFLNLYTDILPDEQYLFVDLIFNTNQIEIKFKLENINGINSTLFNLICSHYSKLNLLNRFNTNSNEIISELIYQIKSFKNKLSILDIKESILDQIKSNKKEFGYNYYKSILEETLINSDEFIIKYT
ncbi:HNH endonuclease [Chishuiella sp.]|uniref:HNH endonuclease n=1 Tax=Chishuiella sp. TaxID=1969467 RepID=UPI0028A84053|nr:HNH endonuclease [Chishuiella sp.]